MKEIFRKAIRFIGYLIGFGIILYPAVSDMVNQRNSTIAITNYDKTVQGITEEEEQRLIAEANAYNARMSGAAEVFDPFSEADQEKNKEYERILNLDGNGMMAYLEIPKLGVHMPVYHGVSEAVLQVGAGHVANTSFPVGGSDTHAVITGHRGLPSAKLFTELDKLVVGNIFYIKVVNEVMAYQVDQILTVEPHQTEDLKIVEGMDYVTLVTCTPYAVNTHRLLVRGKRIPYSEAVELEERVQDKVVLSTYTKAVIVGLFVLFFIWILKIIIRRLMRKHEK